MCVCSGFLICRTYREGELIIRDWILVSSISAAGTVHPYLLPHDHTSCIIQNRKCSSVSYAASCTIRGSKPDGARIVLFFKTFRTSPGYTQPPVHWGPGFFPGDKAVRIVKLNTPIRHRGWKWEELYPFLPLYAFMAWTETAAESDESDTELNSTFLKLY